jgi:fructose-1,6-bisphosphatase/inositol monophosphatase family enzyme
MLLGVMRGGVAEAGVIRMPALGEVFAGCRGGGATWNGRPVRCRPATELKRARMLLNEAEHIMRRRPQVLERLMRAAQFMRFANDCYAFGLLAAGQIDIVVDIGLQPYDYLPTVPVVEAAGGVITDWSGKPLGLDSDGSVVAAGSPELHRAILDVVAA